MRFVALTLLAIGATAHAAPTAELDVADLDFGVIDFNTTSVRYLTVANVGIAPRSPLLVTSAQISGDPGFAFANPACAGATTCSFAPALSITGTAALVAVRCTATSPGTTMVATVTFASDSDDTLHSTAQLTCGVQSNTIAFEPPVLGFGNVDIRAAKPPLVIAHLVNQTASPVGVTALGFAGTGATRFTTPVVAGAIAPANDELAIPITYTPSAENVVDLATLQMTLALATGPGQLTVQLSGMGVDRHASMGMPPTFPATLLGAGYAATVEPITIANTGGAPLRLTNAAITGAPVWSLVNDGPVDIPGNATYPMLVRFAPTQAGAAPPATFSVDTDDPKNPTLTVTLGGSGVDRQAAMGPETVELDYAGVGTTVHGSDPSRKVAITVTNHDPAATYTISAINVFGGEGAFAVMNASGPIGPGESRDFDVSFTPPRTGDFTATAQLFLDLDPAAEASVNLHGTGVFVDAHGDGCNAAGGGGGGALVVVAIALLVLRRKRAAIALVLIAGSAEAQTRDLDLAVFDPTPTTAAPTTFAIPTATIGADGTWVVSGLITFASDPLVLSSPTNDNVTLRDRTTLSLGGAFALGGVFEVAAHLPFYVQTGQDVSSATMFGEPEVSATAIGNLELDGKALFSRYHGPAGELSTGIAVGLQLPTASGERFAGSAKPEARGLLMAHYAPPIAGGHIMLDVGAGGVVRGSAQYNNVDQKSGFDWGGAISVAATRHLAFALEAYGELVPRGLTDAMGNTSALDTAEALLGAHYQIDYRFNLGVAGGRGLTDELGSPGWRGVVTLTVAPTARHELDITHVVSDIDHDGVPDDLDRCPTEPEDKDGFEDADGCPDPDNDHDGIPDAADKCPDQPEDKDGFQDADGCPDPDNDGDGIPDLRDRCPNEPETINGFQDEDGCPDQGTALVAVEKDRLALAAPVDFTAAGKLDPASFGELGQLGATLRAHGELAKLRIVAREAARGDAVRDWLVQYGIARDRLDTAVDPNLGDRIDVLILSR